MSTAVQDTIERTLVIKTDLQTAWRSVGDPAGISKWFAESVEGDFRPGEEAFLIWGAHRVRIRVTVVEEPTRFAYRWIPGSNTGDLPFVDENTTLVMFTLREIEGGVEISLVESGFASLPAEIAAGALSENTDGWTEELAKLVKLYA